MHVKLMTIFNTNIYILKIHIKCNVKAYKKFGSNLSLKRNSNQDACTMQPQTLTIPLCLSIKFSLKPSPPFWLCVTKIQHQTLPFIVKILLLQVSFLQRNENQRAQTFVTKTPKSRCHKKKVFA